MKPGPCDHAAGLTELQASVPAAIASQASRWRCSLSNLPSALLGKQELFN